MQCVLMLRPILLLTLDGPRGRGRVGGAARPRSGAPRAPRRAPAGGRGAPDHAEWWFTEITRSKGMRSGRPGVLFGLLITVTGAPSRSRAPRAPRRAARVDQVLLITQISAR